MRACVALVVLLAACAGVKPCPVALQARYTAALVEACRDAGSIAACGDAGAAVKERHETEQVEAGCRVEH